MRRYSAWLLRETALCGACVAAARVLACGGNLSRGSCGGQSVGFVRWVVCGGSMWPLRGAAVRRLCGGGRVLVCDGTLSRFCAAGSVQR